jgi:hypothetical protein
LLYLLDSPRDYGREYLYHRPFNDDNLLLLLWLRLLRGFNRRIGFLFRPFILRFRIDADGWDHRLEVVGEKHGVLLLDFLCQVARRFSQEILCIRLSFKE